jgi:hypothetical protein
VSPADIIAWRWVPMPAANIRFDPPPERSWAVAPLRACAACDVTWRGGPSCWCCGRTVAGY